jgi:hypothetical protein
LTGAGHPGLQTLGIKAGKGFLAGEPAGFLDAAPGGDGLVQTGWGIDSQMREHDGLLVELKEQKSLSI